MKEYVVKVVIPLYRTDLTDVECNVLRNNLEVVNNHKVVFIVPSNLNLDDLYQKIDLRGYEFITVSEEWLGSKNGIEGYNTMMLSKEFYELFNDSEYILICQTDAYLFRDELLDWCAKGYDYIGAPWIKKKYYSKSYVKFYFFLLGLFRRSEVHVFRHDLLDKVGNGGLSLRRVDKFIRSCEKHYKVIKRFEMHRHNLYNEDVFWALMPKDFKYPSVSNALRFSIDTKPETCMEMNKNVKPFGCHGLGHPHIYSFWRKHLKFNV